MNSVKSLVISVSIHEFTNSDFYSKKRVLKFWFNQFTAFLSGFKSFVLFYDFKKGVQISLRKIYQEAFCNLSFLMQNINKNYCSFLWLVILYVYLHFSIGLILRLFSTIYYTVLRRLSNVHCIYQTYFDAWPITFCLFVVIFPGITFYINWFLISHEKYFTCFVLCLITCYSAFSIASTPQSQCSTISTSSAYEMASNNKKGMSTCSIYNDNSKSIRDSTPRELGFLLSGLRLERSDMDENSVINRKSRGFFTNNYFSIFIKSLFKINFN